MQLLVLSAVVIDCYCDEQLVLLLTDWITGNQQEGSFMVSDTMVQFILVPCSCP